MIVEIDSGELLRQASMTAHDYMYEAVRAIDKLFGEDYAKKHPDLVAAFMKTAAADFHTALLVKVIETVGDRVADAISTAGDR